MNRKDGVALMMVLWVLVLLSVVALNYLNSSKWYSVSTHNLKEETLSYYLALSGFHQAVNYISSDQDPAIDFYDEGGNLRVDDKTPPVTGSRSTPEGELDIRILDETSKININYATPDMLRRLFQFAGVPQEELDVMVDSIQDWKDPDTEHHLSGAEDEYYEGLQEPYKAKNASFDVPEELLLVRGFKPEYAFAEKSGPLKTMLTTFGTGSININTVTNEVMTFLGLNPAEIEAVVKQRGSASGGFRFIPQQFSALGLNSVASNNLRIEVSARATAGGPLARIVAIIERKPSLKGHKLRTVYWREGFENIRG